MKTNCIMCPLGCDLEIKKLTSGEIKVSGNACPRGDAYGKTELTSPVRTLSSLVKVGELVVPVKTSGPVPKEKIEDVLNELSKLNLSAYPPFGTVLVKNILNLNVDVVTIGY